LIRPAELAAQIDSDPIIAFDWPRADLDGGAREFIIGLLATACWRQIVDDDGWEDWWEQPPKSATLDACFAPMREAFLLDGPGPRFLQDLDELEGEAVPAAALLIDTPGANALKNNTDLFVKRGRIEVLSRAAAAIALFTLQAQAPAGGAGHRVSLRGGGPLTTLLLPEAPTTLWHRLWVNVCWEDSWAPSDADMKRIFPWLAPTRVSDKGQVTTPADVHPAQAYWGMPRRIRLDFEANADAAPCDLTGEIDPVVVRSYRTKPRGTDYAAWSRGHALTPYYRTKPDAAEWLPVHPQPGRLGYRDWIGLVLGDDDQGSTAARATAVDAAMRRLSRKGALRARLHASGYDMDNMKARGFVESEMPVRLVGEHMRDDYEIVVRHLVAGAREAAGILSTGVRQALWDREAPAADAGLRRLARDRFWDETERPFHDAVAALADAIEAAAGDEAAIQALLPETRVRWCDRLAQTVWSIFAALVPLDQIEERDAQRLIAARRDLHWALQGYGKSGGALFKALGLPAPPSKEEKAA
jgi:CRISPR system Cascade subunit CasA